MINKITVNKFKINSQNTSIYIQPDVKINKTFKPIFYGSAFFGAFSNRQVVIYATNDLNFNKTIVTIYTKDGGEVKKWYLDQDSDNPLQIIDFELNTKGCGYAKLMFSYTDFPIEAEYQVVIMLAGEVKYRGFIINDIDFGNNEVEAYPFHIRLKEVLYSTTSYTGTVKDLLQDIIESNESITGISWDSSLVDVGFIDDIETTIEDEESTKVIDDLVKLMDNRYWGVDLNNKFYVKEFQLTDIDKYLYQNDDCIFVDMKVNQDYSDIEATRYKVRKKDGTDLGYIPDGSVYSYLPIEQKLRIIYKKFQVSDALSTVDAKRYAYYDLVEKARVKLGVEIKEADIFEYNATIGDRVLVEQKPTITQEVINECDNIINFTNVTLVSGGIKDYCLKLFQGGTISKYDIGESVQYWKQQKIGFYLKSSVANKVIKLSISNDDVTYNDYYFLCKSTNWEYFDIAYINAFRYIKIDKNSNTNDFCIDRILVVCYSKKQYTNNVTQIKYKIDRKGIKQNINLGDLVRQESDDFFRLQRKVQVLESINAI